MSIHEPNEATRYYTNQLMFPRIGEWELADQFERFHEENPHVYERLVYLARRWRHRNPDRACGMQMLFEVARWTMAFTTEGEPLKINNNYVPFYSRLIMYREPELRGLFNIRRQERYWNPAGIE